MGGCALSGSVGAGWVDVHFARMLQMGGWARELQGTGGKAREAGGVELVRSPCSAHCFKHSLAVSITASHTCWVPAMLHCCGHALK